MILFVIIIYEVIEIIITKVTVHVWNNTSGPLELRKCIISKVLDVNNSECFCNSSWYLKEPTTFCIDLCRAPMEPFVNEISNKKAI